MYIVTEFYSLMKYLKHDKSEVHALTPCEKFETKLAYHREMKEL